MVYQKKKERVNVYCDGASRGNPGSSAIAYVITDKKDIELERNTKSIGTCTCNTAEYQAIIEGLKACSSFTRKEVTVCSDSELAINQINKNYRINKNHLKDLYQEVKKIELMFEKVIFIHKPRTNKILQLVDKLANEQLN